MQQQQAVLLQQQMQQQQYQQQRQQQHPQQHNLHQRSLPMAVQKDTRSQPAVSVIGGAGGGFTAVRRGNKQPVNVPLTSSSASSASLHNNHNNHNNIHKPFTSVSKIRAPPGLGGPSLNNKAGSGGAAPSRFTNNTVRGATGAGASGGSQQSLRLPQQTQRRGAPGSGASSESLTTFLASLGLRDYAKSLLAEQLDLNTLALLSDDDLSKFFPLGPRRKLQASLSRRTQIALQTYQASQQQQQQAAAATSAGGGGNKDPSSSSTSSSLPPSLSSSLSSLSSLSSSSVGRVGGLHGVGVSGGGIGGGAGGGPWQRPGRWGVA